ncbi:bestrophin family protein [Niastella sp. OAS944]|uniref:bestrophin family protein n=1 Tax=Niastella sp. OAS944 TaxID=2664089 RepID=UPI003479BF0F|nr:putative membrane protein [Chitinophagaceae bacterium OAS944]
MLLKKNIPIGYVFGKVKIELVIILVYSLAIAVIHEWFLEVPISIPLAVPAVLGTVISLLLGFRSNQAYDRWWEARQVWGAIVNDSRTLARQVLNFTESQYEEDMVHQWRQRMVRRQIAWCYSLGQSLRRMNPTSGLDKFLSKRELEVLSRFNNVPMALLDQHGKDLRRALEEGYINRYQQMEIDKTLTRLCDAMGKCERIKNTVFPSTYSLYIHFSLLLFIAMLPFGVIDYFGFLEVPLVVAISASFLLIEKMAIHLQDPFENKPTDTPMTAIAGTIERDLKQLMHDQDLPEVKNQEKYYYIL